MTTPVPVPVPVPVSALECLLRRTYAPAALLATHPPILRHPNKQLTFELACPPGATHAGSIEVTRWRAAPLPAQVALADTDVTAIPGVYDYAPHDDGTDRTDGTWHVNFADPQLFVAYGSALLAQDELQAVEHPLLGSVREALRAEGVPALTEENLEPTPVLVAGVERRCTLATAPDLDAGRPGGLYGHRFAAASPEVVRAAVHVHATPRATHLIAMAAPGGGRGLYFHHQIERILITAYTAFAAACAESRRRWPGVAVEVRTGFWGCGAFGGNRRLMILMQVLAARLAGVDRLRLYTFDRAGLDDVARGRADLDRVLAAGAPGGPLAALIERVDDLDYAWGQSDGT